MEKNSLHCTCASHERHSCENYAERGRERKRERERERKSYHSGHDEADADGCHDDHDECAGCMMSMMIMMKHLQMDGCQESCSVYDEHDDHDDAYAYDHDEAYANGLFRLLGLY